MDGPPIVEEDVVSPTTPKKPTPRPSKDRGTPTRKSVQSKNKSISKRYRPKIEDGKPKKLSKSKASRKSLDDGARVGEKRKYEKMNKLANSNIPASDPVSTPNTLGPLTPDNVPPERLTGKHSSEPLILEAPRHAKLCSRSLDFSKDASFQDARFQCKVTSSFQSDLYMSPQDFDDCDELKKLINQFHHGNLRARRCKNNVIKCDLINGGDRMRKLDRKPFWDWNKMRMKRMKQKRRLNFDNFIDVIAEKGGIHKRSMVNRRHISWSIFTRKRSRRPFNKNRASLPQTISPHTKEVEENSHSNADDLLKKFCDENDLSRNISRNLAKLTLDTSKDDVNTYSGVEEPSPKLLTDASSQQTEPLISDDVLEQNVLSHDKKGVLVPYKQKGKKPGVGAEVDIDLETMEMGRLVTEFGEMTNEEKISEKWRKGIKIFRLRAKAFIMLMHEFTGNRRFTPWKGSVIDSVVGAFLTQNVSDHLSSSAFMSLRARYPVKPESNNNDECTKIHEETNGSKVCETRPYIESLSTSRVDCHEQENISSLKETLQLEQNDFLEQFYDHHQSEKLSSDLVEELPSHTTSDELAKQNSRSRAKRKKIKEATKSIDWDQLRKAYSSRSFDNTNNTLDSVDWESVRQAPLVDVAATIQKRGQQMVLSRRIKALLDRLVKDHGSTNLEWVRDLPPEKAREFLLSIDGLGQKSVECIRLLTLHHKAFPVDTNVARIAVRLGWIPLKPLPKDIELHVLSEYPPMNKIQEYLWPRLCSIDQGTLYEFHYQLITFGKVFCTKRSPNCNGCPKQFECRHKASKDASDIKKVEGPKNAGDPVSSTTTQILAELILETTSSPELAPKDEASFRDIKDHSCDTDDEIDYSQPLMCLTQEQALELEHRYKILMNKLEESCTGDIEDFTFQVKKEDDHELDLNKAGIEFINNLGNSSQSLIIPENVSEPNRKLKEELRLRTVHDVYELPDDHPLLANLNKREVDDPCPYMFAAIKIGGSSNSSLEENLDFDPSRSKSITTDNMVNGIILHPSRTALKGNFPLNGTYFQVNEVFADFASSQTLIEVHGSLLCYLPRRRLFCGSSTTSIIRGFSLDEVRECLCEKGFICIRGFDYDTGAPRRLPEDLHRMPPNNDKLQEEWWG